jgi:hypothetical protein
MSLGAGAVWALGSVAVSLSGSCANAGAVSSSSDVTRHNLAFMGHLLFLKAAKSQINDFKQTVGKIHCSGTPAARSGAS